MATKEATLLLKIKQTGSSVLKTIKTGFSGLGTAAKAAGLAVATYAGAVVKLAGDASKFDDVKTSFENLAASQGEQADMMLAKMKDLSQGTISDLELMKKANNAMLLGLPVDRFGDMLEIARSSSKATGESMEYMLNSIVTGMGRGSKLMLDNLGILFNVEDAQKEYAASLGKTAAQLTEAEKKQAFINKALAVGKANAEAAGAGQLSLADKFEQTKARAQNLMIVIGQKLAPAFSFLLGKAQEAFTAIETFASSGAATEVFIGMTKAVVVAKNVVVGLAQAMGAQLGTVIGSISQLLSGDFKAAWTTLKDGIIDNFNGIVTKAKETNSELKEVDEAFLADKEARNNKEVAQVKTKNQLLAEENASARATERESWMNDSLTQLDEKIAVDEFKLEQENAAQLASVEQELTNAQTKQDRYQALKKKEELLEKARDQRNVAKMTTMQKFEQFVNSEKVKGTQSALSTVSGLQDSHNKGLVALGKAAAAANIIISTSQGVAAAFALGPILGPILAPIVAVAGGVQLAKVAGVALESGGIVPGTVGGTQATIGEGGRAEAVVPLGDEGGPGGLGSNFYITVYGGLLGDEASAREFAIAVDAELLGLRQSNESQAFDSSLV